MTTWVDLLRNGDIEFATAALDRISLGTDDEMIEACEAAIYNWTLRMVYGAEPFSLVSGRTWVTCADAIHDFGEAKEYWEGKKNARSTETPAAPQGTG